MKNKKLLQIILLIVCLVLIHPMTIFAETEIHFHDDSCLNTYDIDELLALLNAGTIKPVNIISNSISEAAEAYIPISPSNWPWTECSNVLGHSWSQWQAWKEVNSRIHHPRETQCFANFRRLRYCTRTNCGKYDYEHMTAWVNCPCQ
ncbi:MAG: hypothetical protein FWE14_04400 [Lachnospiraceae bacterium]|nr:hypothetical protein [Lachnospiraceae bacterium]